ncbi:MAG: DsrE family protein [Alphaproteobacteria bacterium]|uniref:DsrE family protein n=1 Tax=Candidatus Nitrobium versatile TaxID=2884831 RepID=A0A953JA78_9BACT|nr:DsrE family protein [Candidatus Nitrobium versatile]
MSEPFVKDSAPSSLSEEEDIFIVLCTSGFENIPSARSALMFASLAASANYRTILFCVQGAVDIMIKGAIEKNEKPQPGVPTLAQRLDEARELGVEIQCCSQTMANKKITGEDLIPGVQVAGAMSLIELVNRAKGTLSF